MRSKLFLTIFVLIIALATKAQKLTVDFFKASLKDISASQSRRFDLNGKPCALIKVQLLTQDIAFEGNVVKPVEYKGGEYWVYMTEGSRELRIKHQATKPEFVPLHVIFANYEIDALQSLLTYELVLRLPQATTSTIYDSSKPNEGIDEIVDALKPVNTILPAHMWDGLYLRNVSAVSSDKSIELNISDFYTLDAGKKDIIQNQPNKRDELGVFIIENFMEGYYSKKTNRGGEGEDELFFSIYPMLKTVVRNNWNIKFILTDREGQQISFLLDSKLVEKSVMRTY